MYIGFDENTHVLALEAALRSLGVAPVKACTYSFPYTDVISFIQLSQTLESIGVSAYSGAAALITSSYYTTVAASILAVEALHTSYQRAALGEVPMANPFETPLDGNSVYTLASQITCSPTARSAHARNQIAAAHPCTSSAATGPPLAAHQQQETL